MISKKLGFVELVRFLIAATVVLPSSAALANDGFYQGSGSTLTLVKNSHLRVREERLLITPINPPECYSVYTNGEIIKDGLDVKEDAKISLGERTKCYSNEEQLYAEWHAAADYQVEVLQSQKDVLIGFPVATWERNFLDTEGLNYVHAPAVANFRTYINGKEIKHLSLKKIKSGDAKTGAPDELGYAWKASFSGGKPYHLRTEYDFGTVDSNAFYEGSEFLKGETPWFFEVVDAGEFTANRLIYFLKPISSWASPPPEQIKIEVRLPSEIPVTYFVPLELKPACVTTSALHYLLENQFPSYELSLSMPNTGWWKRKNLKPLTTLAQWNSWQKSLGGESVKIGCDVIEELKKTAAPDLQTHIGTYQCVASCSE